MDVPATQLLGRDLLAGGGFHQWRSSQKNRALIAHNDRFIAILEEHFPTWRDARAELNELPLTSEVWNE